MSSLDIQEEHKVGMLFRSMALVPYQSYPHTPLLHLSNYLQRLDMKDDWKRPLLSIQVEESYEGTVVYDEQNVKIRYR